MLPDTMPPQFSATYTPIAAAGTQAQIKHLARLLATQLTAAGLGKGAAEVQQNASKEVSSQAMHATPMCLCYGHRLLCITEYTSSHLMSLNVCVFCWYLQPPYITECVCVLLVPPVTVYY